MHELKRESDLEREFPGTVLRIRKGVFRRLLEGKTVRFHEPGDWITTGDGDCGAFNIMSEFGSEVCVYPGETFRGFLAANPRALDLWIRYGALEQRINLGIAGMYMPEEARRHIRLLEFKPGETIIREGEPSRHVFELVQGSAAVSCKGVRLSTIAEGEIFGEISYFSATERTATVTALSQCLVQAMDNENFAAAIRRRPETVLRLIRALCDRLLSVDRRLVDGQV